MLPDHIPSGLAVCLVLLLGLAAPDLGDALQGGNAGHLVGDDRGPDGARVLGHVDGGGRPDPGPLGLGLEGVASLTLGHPRLIPPVVAPLPIERHLGLVGKLHILARGDAIQCGDLAGVRGPDPCLVQGQHAFGRGLGPAGELLGADLPVKVSTETFGLLLKGQPVPGIGLDAAGDQQGQSPAAAAVVPRELSDVGLQAVIRLLCGVRHHTATATFAVRRPPCAGFAAVSSRIVIQAVANSSLTSASRAAGSCCSTSRAEG